MKLEIVHDTNVIIVSVNDEEEQICGTMAEALFWASKQLYEAGMDELRDRISRL